MPTTRVFVAFAALLLICPRVSGRAPSRNPSDWEIGEFARLAANADIETVKKRCREFPELAVARDYRGWTALMSVAYAGKVETAKFLISKGADVNARDELGMSPLIQSAANGQLEMVKLLISKGADVNAGDSLNATPLWFGVDHPEIVRVLLANKADVNQRLKTNSTALAESVKRRAWQTVELLLAHGADVNAVDTSGATALGSIDTKSVADDSAARDATAALLRKHGAVAASDLFAAVESGEIAEVRRLLQFAPGLIHSNEYDPVLSALGRAVKAGHMEIARLLLAAGVTVKLPHGYRTTLHIAAETGRPEFVELLLTHGADLAAQDEEGRSVLHHAAARGDAALVKRLVVAGAQIATMDKLGRTALHLAAEAGNVSTAGALLDSGALVDRASQDGKNPLHFAAAAGHAEMVRLLLDRGAAANTKDSAGRTPLDHAVQSGNADAIAALHARDAFEEKDLIAAVHAGDADKVRSLLERGARIDVRDSEGLSPLRVVAARQNRKIVRLIVEHGPESPVITAANAEDRKIVGLLVEHGADINETWMVNSMDYGKIKSTLLDEAVSRRDRSFAEFLLAHGATADISAPHVSPLYVAVQAHDPIMVELLASHGANVAVRDFLLWTPLDMAVHHGDTPVAEVLLKHHSPVNEPDYEGVRLLEVAEKSGFEAMVALLRAHGAFSAKMVDDLFDTIERGGDFSEINHVADLLKAAPGMINLRRKGDTPLLAALKHSNFLMVSAIVAAKPDMNLADEAGVTPLFLSASNSLYCALMISAGADVNARNGPRKLTALMRAAQGETAGDLAAAISLLKAGADVRAADVDGATALHYAAQESGEAMVELLIEHRPDLNARARNGGTALLSAVIAKNLGTLEALIQAGANPNDAGGNQMTSPLFVAIGQDDTNPVGAVRLLIRGGADVNQLWKNGMRPLHAAAINGSLELVRLLLDASADPNAAAKSGLLPLDAALQEQNWDVADLLRSRGGRSAKDPR